MKKNANTVKGALLAIICGFIVAGIVIACLNVNPFSYFAKMFQLAFNPLFKAQTLQWVAIYTVAGLSVGVGFAAGLFNIGVAGQMLAGASLSTVAVNLMYPNGLEHIGGGVVFLIFVICVSIATLLAVISGWLKTRFNIHEVVSTIMLNWIVWYTIKFVFLKWKTKFASSGASTNPFPTGLLDWGSSQVAIPLIVAGICVILVWFLLKKTVFGFKMKAVGYSGTVARYAGVNVTQKVLVTMAISGFLAGIASFLNILTISPNIFFGIDNLPTVGYDAIAVTLVAFNNPWGIVLVSLLWAIAQSAGTVTAAMFTLPSQMSLLVFGFIVYFAAISIVFIRWNPITKIRLWWYIHHSPTHQSYLDRLHGELTNYRWWKRDPKSNPTYSAEYQKYKKASERTITKKERAVLKEDWENYRAEFKEQYALKANRVENEMRNYKVKVYNEELKSGLVGIRSRAAKRLRLVDQNGIEAVSNSKLNYVKAKNNFKKYNYRFTHHYRTELKTERAEYRKDKKALRVWREGEIGVIKGTFDYENGKIALKGEYQKRKNIIKEDKKTAWSEKRLALHLIKFDETLSKSAKQEKIEKVKADYVAQKKTLNADLQLAKKDYQDGLQQLKAARQEKRASLQQNPKPLNDVENQYKEKLAVLKSNHAKALANIHQRNEEHAHMINKSAAKANLHEGQKMIQDCINKLTYFKNKPKTTEKQISKLNEEIRSINETLSKVNKHFGGARFKEFDDNCTVNRKTSALIKLLRYSYTWNTEKDIVINNNLEAKTRKINKTIEHDYNKFLRKNPEMAEQGWEKVRVRIKYDPETVKKDKFVKQEVNKAINNIEEKYGQEGI